jgi:hypothetical protein
VGARTVLRASVVVALALVATACGGSDPAADPAPRLGAEIVQLRRDEVLRRVEVAVTNRTGEQVTVESIDLRVPGFGGGGVQRKDEPLLAGQVVDLPTPYGEVRCTGDGRAGVGRPRVVVRVHTASDPTSRRVVLRPRDPQGLLDRIAAGECLARRLTREVSLSFGPAWRLSGSGEGAAVHGVLRARLRTDQPRDLTQLAGTVIYGLVAETAAGRPVDPLAHLTPEQPEAQVPVVVTRSRCDGHARAETKKPYAFLVWLAAPGGEEHAVSPLISAADRAAFDQVCPL